MNDLWKFLSDYSHGITLNANDTFGWGCAESCEVDILDIPKLRQMETKYGYEGVLAFMAKVKKEDPLSQLVNARYKAAKKELKSYTLVDNLDPNNKKTWDTWWKEYKSLTGETD